ncbi:hypothetical protein [Gimibacter soli]|uniref:Uncharacterized protein n=1 Tax=Gimibacter soli TaxID=3024400 RepID=A0AAE9XNF2_9PROT|nr:hypothetical protein [Gimibacter soli]WCL54222.1 hypothetical protein PH603_00425 [Gimibacter soli]
MTANGDMIGVGVSLVVAAIGFWQERRYTPGKLPLVPPFFLMFTGALGAIVFGADLITALTGVTWSPGFQR